MVFFGLGQAKAGLKTSSMEFYNIDILRKLAANRSVSRIEIYNMPWYIESVASFNADTLRANAQYKLSISFAEAQITRWKLINALEKTKEDTRADVGDLRWGFVFFDREKKEVFCLYATGKCKTGLIQGRLVKFDPTFWFWVKQRFGVTFDQDLE